MLAVLGAVLVLLGLATALYRGLSTAAFRVATAEQFDRNEERERPEEQPRPASRFPYARWVLAGSLLATGLYMIWLDGQLGAPGEHTTSEPLEPLPPQGEPSEVPPGFWLLVMLAFLPRVILGLDQRLNGPISRWLEARFEVESNPRARFTWIGIQMAYGLAVLLFAWARVSGN